MNAMEFNKAVAAVLVAGITFFACGLVGKALVRVTPLEKPAFQIETAPAGPAATPEAPPPVANLMASADPAAGEAVARKVCAACHSFTPEGKAGVGPNLYGIVGAGHGAKPGFGYSAALKGKPGDWTFDALNEWLAAPAKYAPGTKMAFAGLAKPQERANVIDYLRTLSASPLPRPAPVAVSAPAAAEKPPSLGALLAAGDAARGQADLLKYACIACHTFNEGGKAGVGPNLYGVVGGPKAHMPGFDYSPGMKSKGGTWTYEELDAWLTKPSGFIPGTKMALAGVTVGADRADLIAYLRSISPKAPALPAP